MEPCVPPAPILYQFEPSRAGHGLPNFESSALLPKRYMRRKSFTFQWNLLCLIKQGISDTARHSDTEPRQPRFPRRDR